MEMFWIAVIWVLNFVISWWNAKACGKVWAETKAAGGWHRFMTWMGAIMSASGFTWCYIILLGFAGNSLGVVPPETLKLALELGYVLLVPGILFSGLMITVDSWATAFRQGGILNYGTAVWNTYAQVHNTMGALQTFGQAFGDIFKALSGGGSSSSNSSSSDDNDGAAIVFAIIIVVVALSAGIITTTIIIRKNAASEALPDDVRRQLARR